MPNIKPIKCFRPAKSFAPKFIRKPSDMSGFDRDISNLRKILKNTAFEISQPNLFGQTFQESISIFNHLIRNSYVRAEYEEGLYLYKITSGEHTQIGLVCSQSINDLNNGKLKMHEKTKSVNSKFIEERFKELNLMFTPVYSVLPDSESVFKNLLYSLINTIQPDNIIETDDDVIHEIYKITDTETQQQLLSIAQSANAVYLADGHHRLTAAQNVFTKDVFVPTILFSSLDVNLFSFAKIIKEAEMHQIAQFLSYFELHAMHHNVQSIAQVYIGGDWHQLVPRSMNVLNTKTNIDTLFSLNKLLETSFEIENNEDDLNLLFFKDLYGSLSIQNYVNKIKADFAIRFTPLNIEDVFTVADNKVILPAKSTLFEPKPRAGLFISSF